MIMKMVSTNSHCFLKPENSLNQNATFFLVAHTDNRMVRLKEGKLTKSI
jgi:hypothetical protein